MQGAYYENKKPKISNEKKEKWIREQQYIRNKILKQDVFEWNFNNLQLVAGVDVSFSGKFQNGACVGLLIYSVKQRKILYEDYQYVILKQEYIPGFLAFRELPPTLELFKRLKANKPELWPQIILVDGNGILHKFQCGYASHLGVVLDIPSIGCAKTFFDIDGMHQSQIEDFLKQKLQQYGQSIILKGKSGRQWCSAMLTDENQNQHIYISIGHRISLKTATEIVHHLTKYESPQPVRLVDKNSRKMIKKMKKDDYDNAKSFEIQFLHLK